MFWHKQPNDEEAFLAAVTAVIQQLRVVEVTTTYNFMYLGKLSRLDESTARCQSDPQTPSSNFNSTEAANLRRLHYNKPQQQL